MYQALRMMLVSILVGIVLYPGQGFAGDWPQWRGANRDGWSTDEDLMKNWPGSGPGLNWKIKSIGGGFSGVAVTDGVVYTMGDRDGACKVFALKESDGRMVWSARVGEPGGHKNYPGPRATPTVDGNRLFVITQHGDLVCLDRASGKPVWRKNFTKDFNGKMMSGWRWSESALVDGGRVVCTPGGAGGAVVALNKNNGSLLWRCKDFKDPAGYSSIMISELGGVRQYVQLTGKSVAGIEAESGKLLWRGDRLGKTAVITTPVLKDNLVFVTSAYGIGCNLFKVTKSGSRFSARQVYAKKDLDNHHGGVIRVDEHLYGTDNSKLVCMEMATGKIKWTDRSVGKGSIAYADGMLVVRSEKGAGTVALVRASPDAYRELGRFDQPDRSKARSWPHPVIANGNLYLRDQSVLLCYDLK